MEAVGIARRLADIGESAAACDAYVCAVSEGAEPGEVMEAAVYILQSGGDYRISYTYLCSLFNQGLFQDDIRDIMTQAFYEPNVKQQKSRYEKNCRLLTKYSYLFRKDFPPFEELPIRFFPYDDNGFVPFFTADERFGEYTDFKNPVISRNFFNDLENPILADDVYSQYELEYLNDNVRDSTSVGRENHVYLHYADWGVFCSHLQVLNLYSLLKERKFVFLIADEIAQYPMDFKVRFGIDYSRFTPKPVGVREVQRIIWHTQLSAHNGGDFFNEVFDHHPNLLALPSLLLPDFIEHIARVRALLKSAGNEKEFVRGASQWGGAEIFSELYRMRNPTDKDILVALYLGGMAGTGLDHRSRIAPAVFFQPHFTKIECSLLNMGEGKVFPVSNSRQELQTAAFLRDFKYIKTFTPMRRMTNSYAATVRFMWLMANAAKPQEAADPLCRLTVVSDAVTERILNRTFMIDPEDRLYKDCILVRFEDSKLNPKAVFTALAAFLDLPYTESMTECTEGGKPVAPNGNAVGFDPDRVYRKYEEFANDSERYFIEYFMRDVYEQYGYDFHYYDGAPVDEAKAAELIAGFSTLNGYIRETWRKEADRVEITGIDGLTPELEEQIRCQLIEDHIRQLDENRLNAAKTLLRNPQFVNRNGQPLRMMSLLKPDLALLEQPLYH